MLLVDLIHDGRHVEFAIIVQIMCRSNRNLNIPPPGKPRAFDYFLCPGSGEFDLYLGGVGKIEPEVSGFKWFSFSGAEVANSYKHVFGRDGRV